MNTDNIHYIDVIYICIILYYICCILYISYIIFIYNIYINTDKRVKLEKLYKVGSIRTSETNSIPLRPTLCSFF